MVLTLRTRFVLSVSLSVLLCSSAFLLSTPHDHAQLLHFFITDLPPLHGSIRILAYSGVLLISLTSFISRPPFGDSPLQAPELFRYTLPSFFSLEGSMALLDRRWLSYGRLRAIRAVMLAAWLLCIVGLGGATPPALLGLSMLLLHGVVSGCIGTSHRWYVPVYTALALMFANGNAELSLDALLAARFPASYPFTGHLQQQPTAAASASSLSLLHTGFARKLVLVASISTLFFGGITKLLNGGWKWLNGRSLAYYVSSEENGRWGLLKQLMHTQPVLSFFLSVSSIVLECGAVIALFSRWWRPLVLLNAAAFHFGIWLTMWPNYAPQTACYAIGTQWPWESLPSYPQLVPAALLASPASRLPAYALLLSASPPAYLHSSLFLASCLAALLCVFLTVVTLLRIEYWPLTGIPMYSFYRDTSFSYRHLRDEQQAQYVAVEHCGSGYPNALAWSNLWIILRLKNTAPHVKQEITEAKRRRRELAAASASGRGGGGSARGRRCDDGIGSVEDVEERWYVNLKGRVTRDGAPHGVLTKQWRRTLHNVAALDMAAKPTGRIHAPKDGEGAVIEAEESEGETSQGETEQETEAGEQEEKQRDAAADDDASPVAAASTLRHRPPASSPSSSPSASSSSASPRQSSRPVYPGECWLLSQRDSLRRYAVECDWQLPSWAEQTGELQLRCRLRHGYAVLARCPWRPDTVKD